MSDFGKILGTFVINCGECFVKILETFEIHFAEVTPPLCFIKMKKNNNFLEK